MSHPRALGEAKLKRIIGWKATSHATSLIIVIIVIIVRRPRMCLAEDVPLVERRLQFAECLSGHGAKRAQAMVLLRAYVDPSN